VEVDLESIRYRVVVDTGRQPAGTDERIGVESLPISDRAKLVRRVARVLASSAAYVDTEFARARSQSAAKRAHDGCSDSGGVPIHSHDGTERLEPERIAQP